MNIGTAAAAMMRPSGLERVEVMLCSFPLW